MIWFDVEGVAPGCHRLGWIAAIMENRSDSQPRIEVMSIYSCCALKVGECFVNAVEIEVQQAALVPRI